MRMVLMVALSQKKGPPREDEEGSVGGLLRGEAAPDEVDAEVGWVVAGTSAIGCHTPAGRARDA